MVSAYFLKEITRKEEARAMFKNDIAMEVGQSS